MDEQLDECSTTYDSCRVAPQSKLLETIYEYPKQNTDGKRQFTSVRKYKRFIDFATGPTASKKWKRSQKARKLASSRLVHAVAAHLHSSSDQCDDLPVSRRLARNTKVRVSSACTERPPLQEGSETQTKSQCCNEVANVFRVCDADNVYTIRKWDVVSRAVPVCNESELPEAFVVSSTDLVVEEAATVELPLDWMGSRKGEDNMDDQVPASVDNLACVASTSTPPWSHSLPCPQENQATFCYSSSSSSSSRAQMVN